MDIDERGLAGPIQVEGVPCAVWIRLSRRLDVWAFDGSGRRREGGRLDG